MGDRGTAGARMTSALVLGGGGSAGNAWLVGVIAGLFDTGVDVTRADLVIGTSAGATAAAQLAGTTPAELLARALAPAPERQTAPGRTERQPGVAGPERHAAQGRPGQSDAPAGQSDHLDRLRRIIASADSASDMRRKIGAAALETDASPDGSARWRATVASRLPSEQWPEHPLLITAVDARTGEPVVFDRDSGVELTDAVAASTSNGFGVPPYRIGDRRYIDGGYRRNENADLAAGYGRVLVLSPLGGRTLHPLEWGMQLSAQVDELRADGSSVETIVPDADSLTAFGGNMMNLAARPPAARSGYAQGQALAAQLAAFWG